MAQRGAAALFVAPAVCVTAVAALALARQAEEPAPAPGGASAAAPAMRLAAMMQASAACGEVDVVGRPGEPDNPDAVRELQLGLRLLALFPYPIDGVYDRPTREAVRAFQARHGLQPDGVAGPETWKALARTFENEAADMVASQRAASRSAPPPRHVPRHPDVKPGSYWIVIDTNEVHLTLYRDDELVGRWPVAVGKPETITPVGEWRIVRKARDWGGGFGTRWLELDVPWGIYGIHGTNKPWSIGSRASGGCIRMFNSDVEKIWEIVPEGTPVTIAGVQPEAVWESPVQAGAKGWNVPVLQWALRRAGFDPGRADGRMGESTMRAVAEAQRVLGLPRVQAATLDLFRALGLRGGRR